MDELPPVRYECWSDDYKDEPVRAYVEIEPFDAARSWAETMWQAIGEPKRMAVSVRAADGTLTKWDVRAVVRVEFDVMRIGEEG